MYAFSATEMTHVGTVREVNEDAVLSRSATQLWVVADGMGGYEAGDVASNMLVEALKNVELNNSLASNIDELETAVINVNQKIIEYSNTVLDGRVFGSTVVLIYVYEDIGFVLWAGDSRLYRLKNRKLIRLTHDHSQLQEMLDSNLLMEHEIDDYPDSNIITRAVGAEEKLRLDFFTFKIEEDDKFLLCSDGLYNAVADEVIESLLNSGSINLNSKQLIDTALENGANDNISFIVIQNNDGQTITNVKYKD